MYTGSQLIAEERLRQINGEGWTDDHDDKHNTGDLGMAAVCYAFNAISLPTIESKIFVRDHWPWGWQWWKPTPDDKIRQLTKAGALIAAEIDRLQRIG